MKQKQVLQEQNPRNNETETGIARIEPNETETGIARIEPNEIARIDETETGKNRTQ